MAKYKTHANHNQNPKAHRNGIKRPICKRMDQKFLTNQKFFPKGNFYGFEAKKLFEERIDDETETSNVSASLKVTKKLKNVVGAKDDSHF